MKISIVFPVLNEEKRLENGILKTRKYFLEKKPEVEFELIIADNGSVDKTEQIACMLEEKHEDVRYLKLRERGVGYAFREGAKVSIGDVVGYMDIDISTDLRAFEYVIEDIEVNHIDIINSSRHLRQSLVEGRPFFREFISKSHILIANTLLSMGLTDYMCGFKFFRREVLFDLIPKCSEEKGWFFCAELLIIGERNGYLIKEIPVIWIDERENSKVDAQIVKLAMNYMKNILRLRKSRRSH